MPAIVPNLLRTGTPHAEHAPSGEGPCGQEGQSQDTGYSPANRSTSRKYRARSQRRPRPRRPAYVYGRQARTQGFSTLLHKPSKAAKPGEIPWNDFLHAVDVMGFGIKKLYGSVWQNSPTELDVERAIQFHEPHPIPKIAFRMMKRFGRRLARALDGMGICLSWGVMYGVNRAR